MPTGLTVPHALDEDEPPAGAQQSAPVPQDAPGVGQRPQHMAAEQDVEQLLTDGRCRSVTDQEHRVTPGELGAGQVDHARREVDPCDVMPPPGREE